MSPLRRLRSSCALRRRWVVAASVAAGLAPSLAAAGEPTLADFAPARGTGQLVVYCGLIVLASLFGGWLPTLITLTHKRMQVMMSAVGGLMLGIALFHMLPHALEELGPGHSDFVMVWVMIGLLAMFFLLRTFHFHHHDAGVTDAPTQCDHDHDRDHAPHAAAGHHHDHGGEPHGPHELSWMAVFLGLGLHTLIDGLALAASVQVDAARGGDARLFGVGTFLAILAHKPLDAISITSLMSSRRWRPAAKTAVNAAFAMMCPLGAGLFVFGLGSFTVSEELVLGGALAFSAGVFLCISLSDLLPEMEFHSHHRLLLSGALLAGIALAWCVHWLEPPHVHGRAGAAPPNLSAP